MFIWPVAIGTGLISVVPVVFLLLLLLLKGTNEFEF